MRQFEADTSSADNNEMLGSFLQIENGFAGEKRSAIESGNRGNDGLRSRSNNETARANLEVARRHRSRILELRMRADDPNAQPGESLHGVRWLYRRDDRMHVVAHLGEIDADILNLEPERGRAADGLGPSRRRQQRFRRNGSGVETVAAHRLAFDQHGWHAEGSRGRGDRQAAGARADHANIWCQCFSHAPDRSALTSCGGARARPPVFHHDRHQREQTERDERCDELWRQNIRRIERQPTI